MAHTTLASAPALRASKPRPATLWVRYLVRPCFSACRGALRGLSAGSADLVAEGPLEPGAVVLLELPGSEPADVRSRLARVVRAEVQPDGSWLVGCRFTPPLSGEELALVHG